MRLFALLLCLISVSSVAQTTLHFDPRYNGQTIQLDSSYSFHDQPLSISQFKCYISKIELHYKNNLVWEEQNSYHLLDAEKPSSLLLNLKAPSTIEYDCISFQIGVDSITNMAGAMGGDLDPTKGMYWTWNSGYINFKLEGHSPICKTRKNAFQYHLGGYQHPYNSLQKMKIKTSNKKVHVAILLDNFLERVAPSTTTHVMSPGVKSMKLSDDLQYIFELIE